MTITIPVPTSTLEEVTFATGDLIELGKSEARAVVTTEGGVRLLLVAPLGARP